MQSISIRDGLLPEVPFAWVMIPGLLSRLGALALHLIDQHLVSWIGAAASGKGGTNSETMSVGTVTAVVPVSVWEASAPDAEASSQ